MSPFRVDPPDGRWGDRSGELTPAAAELLASVVGPPGAVIVGGDAAAARSVPASRLTSTQLAFLSSLLGADAVSVDPALRFARSHGLSYGDLVAARVGDLPFVVDAVVAPGSADDVSSLLEWCSAAGIAVIPFGGGTSVVGGVTPAAELARFVAVISVSLERLDALISLDPISALAVVEPGITGPVLERLLAARGFTLGHFPQSFERATIGGYIAARSAGQASTGYGRIDDLVSSIELSAPAGVLRCGVGPSSAAGPALLRAVLGSEGAFGIVTQATLKLRPLPTVRTYVGAMAPSFEVGMSAFRALAQSGASADIMRLSDESETSTTLAMSSPAGIVGRAFSGYLDARGVSSGSLMILGWEGTDSALISARRRAASRVLRSLGIVGLGGSAGSSWARHRYEGPYLRDTLIDSGYFVETLESAASWSRLAELHSLVLSVLGEALPGCFVMAHVSHVYSSGASLYFTVLDQQQDASVAAASWASAKANVTTALVSSGFTVSHHHGVGRDHMSGLTAEIGSLGMEALRALKSTFDPNGIMNPGVLVP